MTRVSDEVLRYSIAGTGPEMFANSAMCSSAPSPSATGRRLGLRICHKHYGAHIPTAQKLHISESSESNYPGAEMSFKEARDIITLSFERQYLEDLLERADGNLTRAASVAGIDRKTVARMLKKHGMK